MVALSAERYTRSFTVALWVIVAGTTLATTALAQPNRRESAPFATGWQAGTPEDVTGELRLQYLDDLASGRAELVHSLRDRRTGQLRRLRFETDARLAFPAGTTIRVRGRAYGSEIYVTADGTGHVESVERPTASPSAGSGIQNTLVIIANFQDTAVTCSPTAIDALMFSEPLNRSVDDLFRETSRNHVGFTGSVAGPYTLTGHRSTDACDFDAWANAADALASTNANLNAYSRKLYVMPANSCPAAGVGDLGGSQTRAWVFTCGTADVYAHELGHNLGMHHASSTTSEYGDSTDIMGKGQNRLRGVNAPHQLQMGWLPPAQVQSITEDGTYSVEALDVDPASAGGAQAWKVRKRDTDEYYYLSYRRAKGFDANIWGTSLDRLSIHRWKGGSTQTVVVAALADGETYTDSANGITITQESHTTTTSLARVQLAAAGGRCSRFRPTLSLQPAPVSSNRADPGASVAYTFGLTNNDSASCPTGTFALTYQVPTGWTGVVSPPSLSVPPGAQAEATFTVTSPFGAAAGNYGVTILTSESGVQAHTASTGSTYTVLSATCERQAPVVYLSPNSRTGFPGQALSYSLSITNRDSTRCSDSAWAITAPDLRTDWTANVTPQPTIVSPGATAGASVTITSASLEMAGSYQFTVSGSDGAGRTFTSAATYTVQAADTHQPTAPTGLTASVKRGSVRLSWSASTDNVGVLGYRIYRETITSTGPITSVAGTSSVTGFTDSPGAGTYTYTVKAYDGAGNESAASNAVTVNVR